MTSYTGIDHFLESSTSQIPVSLVSACHICLSCTSHTRWLRTDAIYAHGTEIPYKVIGSQTATWDFKFSFSRLYFYRIDAFLIAWWILGSWSGGENVGSNWLLLLPAGCAAGQVIKKRRSLGSGSRGTPELCFDIRFVSSLIFKR